MVSAYLCNITVKSFLKNVLNQVNSLNVNLHVRLIILASVALSCF